MFSSPSYPRLTADDFLRMTFGENKAELDVGVIRMMAGGTARHVQIQGNLLRTLGALLRGGGCKPYPSSMATRTHDLSVRYPDVSVFCNRTDPANDDAKAFDDPRVLFEVLSAGTARTDLRVKLDEYKALDSVDTIVFVDIATERLRVIQRTGPHAWQDESHDAPVDLSLPALGVVVPHHEIFARD
ncbi:Uma2 family endonuclease [Sphingomonas sp. CLY1604]|uniref:Uma2 family endonuclease n=1 Tax=Sphingomonas sp. CLY1604 TaxID=3457786 RepID=UPI003FD8AC79